MQQQQSLPAFGQANGTQQGGFSFGQQSNGNTPSRTSQSFPPFGGPASTTGGFGNAFTAPSGSFSFNTPPVNNPFTNLNAGAPVTSQNGGFHGSIFHFEAPLDAHQRELTGEAPPLFTPAKTSTNDMFARTNSPQVQNAGSNTASSTDNIFSHLTTPQATSQQQPENPFAASIAKFQERQKNATSNQFGSLNTQPSQPSTSLFNTTPTAGMQTQPALFSPEAMQTSPDTTPQKNSPAQSTTFSFATNATNQSQTNQAGLHSASTNGSGLFGRVTEPPSDMSAQAPFSLGSAREGQATGGGLFDRVSTPTDRESGTNVSEAALLEQTSKTTEPSSNLPNSVKMPVGADGTTPSEEPYVDQAAIFAAAYEARKDELDWQSDESEPEEEPGPWSVPRCYFSKEEEKIQYHIGLRLKRLDAGFQLNIKNYSEEDIPRAIEFYKLQKQAILNAGRGPVEKIAGQKRQASSIYESSSVPVKKQKAPPSSSGPASTLREDSEDNSHSSTPSKTNESLQPFTNTNGKRKADAELARDGTPVAENTKRARGPDSPHKSQTASLFSNIVDTGTSAHTMSEASRLSTQPSAQVIPQPSDTSGPGTSPFTFKPFSTPAAAPNSIKPPTFGYVSSTSFMSQFGEAAKKNAEKEKNKRKAREYDSDEEDEATWEKKDAEEQQKKRLKIEEAAKTAKKFVPAFGPNPTPSAPTEDKNIVAPPTESQPRPTSDTIVVPPPKAQTKSVFDTTNPAFKPTEDKDTVAPQPESQPKSIFDTTNAAFNHTSHKNIFGHLADQNVRADSGQNNKTDDEDDDADEHEETASTAKPNPFGKASNPAPFPGKSLFDRVSKNGNTISPTKPDPSSSQESPRFDYTWKPGSPVDFNVKPTVSQATPSVNVTSPSPSKSPFAGLFGAGNAFQPASKPGASIFSEFQSTTPSTGLSFGFGPVKPSNTALVPPSDISSRATSPGATTGESAPESGAEGTDDSTQKDVQANFLLERAGEEHETIVFEVRAKGLRYEPDTKTWVSKGVGPFRVLQHRETGKRRMILRADPSGKVVINSGFVKELTYEFIGSNTVRLPLLDESDTVRAWHLRIKNAQEGKELGEVLEESKNFV